MRTIKECVPVLEQKLNSLKQILNACQQHEDSGESNLRIVNANLISSELQEIIKFLELGEDDFGCEIVPKEQFQQTTKLSEIVRIEYDGLFGAIASCSRFPIEDPFYVVFSETIDKAINFKI